MMECHPGHQVKFRCTASWSFAREHYREELNWWCRTCWYGLWMVGYHYELLMKLPTDWIQNQCRLQTYGCDSTGNQQLQTRHNHCMTSSCQIHDLMCMEVVEHLGVWDSLDHYRFSLCRGELSTNCMSMKRSHVPLMMGWYDLVTWGRLWAWLSELALLPGGWSTSKPPVESISVSAECRSSKVSCGASYSKSWWLPWPSSMTFSKSDGLNTIPKSRLPLAWVWLSEAPSDLLQLCEWYVELDKGHPGPDWDANDELHL